MAQSRTAPPPFYFRIDQMSEHPSHIPNQDVYGRWSPPTRQGGNLLTAIGPTFYCDGTRIALAPGPPTHQPFRSYSLYYDHGVFWILNYNATTTSVPRSEPSGGGFNGWQLLSFDYPENNLTSFVCYAGEHRRLRYQTPQQAWVQRLLPTAHQTSWSNIRGALNGELPLILGLLAYSTNTACHQEMFSRYFGAGIWNVSNETQNCGYGWTDGRGMVVHVWAFPPYSTNDYLEWYERGAYGDILP